MGAQITGSVTVATEGRLGQEGWQRALEIDLKVRVVRSISGGQGRQMQPLDGGSFVVGLALSDPYFFILCQG